MIDQTIQDLERRIQQAKNLTPTQRHDLQGLLDELRRELGVLAQTHEEDAASILGFAGVTAGEGLKERKDATLLAIAVSGIRASVSKFETSHPSLTLATNNIATYFSNLGI